MQENEGTVDSDKQFEAADDSFQDLMSSFSQDVELESDDLEGLVSQELGQADDNTSDSPSSKENESTVKEQGKSELSVSSESDLKEVHTGIHLNERMAKLLRESNEASSKLLNSIAHARGVLEGFSRERQQLGDVIEKKRKESAKLKEMISVSEQNTTITDEEFAKQSEVTVKANCSEIIELTKNIQAEHSDHNLKNWLGDVERIEKETKMLKMRMQYIELLEEIDRDFVTYQRIRKEEKESTLRFQNCRSFFE